MSDAQPPVSIMCGLYVRVWWETVKRQRDLQFLQAGKKASSKRSDSRCTTDHRNCPVTHRLVPVRRLSRCKRGNTPMLLGNVFQIVM